MLRASPVALAVCLTGCCCIAGNSAASTPLDAPIESDHAVANATVAMIHGSSFQRGTNDFDVQVTNANGTPAVLLHVTATMPSDGHSAVPASIVSLGDGRYRVDALDLEMSGGWVIRLAVSQTGATVDDQVTVLTQVD